MSADTRDMAEILEQLRAEVRARRQELIAASDDGTAAAFERQLRHNIEQLEITRVISAHWPLEGRSLPRRTINFVNKVVRRGLRWYINPIVEQQNAFNDTTTRTLRLLAEAYSELLHDQGELATAEKKTAASDLIHPPANVPTAELQALIAELGEAEPPAVLADMTIRALPDRLAARQVIQAHWPFPAGTMLQKVAAFVQKVIRFYLRWYINPIVEQQNAFNAAVGDAVRTLVRVDAEARVRVAARRAHAHQLSLES